MRGPHGKETEKDGPGAGAETSTAPSPYQEAEGGPDGPLNMGGTTKAGVFVP